MWPRHDSTTFFGKIDALLYLELFNILEMMGMLELDGDADDDNLVNIDSFHYDMTQHLTEKVER